MIPHSAGRTVACTHERRFTFWGEGKKRGRAKEGRGGVSMQGASCRNGFDDTVSRLRLASGPVVLRRAQSQARSRPGPAVGTAPDSTGFRAVGKLGRKPFRVCDGILNLICSAKIPGQETNGCIYVHGIWISFVFIGRMG